MSQFRELCESVRYSPDVGVPAAESLNSNRRDRLLRDIAYRFRANGLAITPGSAPSLAKCIETTALALRLELMPEAYVVNDPACTAFVPAIADGERPIVILSGSLINLLSINELVFVIGHELGHLGLGHGPDEVDPATQTEAAAVSQAREISADRVGLIASRSVFVAASVMVKLASGLSSEMLGMDLDAFIRQVEEGDGLSAEALGLFHTHPALPIRLWALVRFSHCSAYADLSESGSTGTSIDTVNREVDERFDAIRRSAVRGDVGLVIDLAIAWSVALYAPKEAADLAGERLTELVCKSRHFLEEFGHEAAMRRLRDCWRRSEEAQATESVLESLMSLNSEKGREGWVRRAIAAASEESST